MVAYVDRQQLRLTTLVDNATAPATGGQIRVINLSTDVGAVNVYLGAAGTDPTTSTALVSGFTGTSAYSPQTAGNYRVVVTGNTSTSDVRLDIPSFPLADQQSLTLVLSSATSGTLLDGLLITQGGTTDARKNTTARLRIITNLIPPTALVSVTTSDGTNTATVTSNQSSPRISLYSSIPSGALTTNITVNGTALADPGITAAPGADLTLLITGNAGAPTIAPIIVDDNTRPAVNNVAKIRLLNGINNLAGTISLANNLTPIINGVAANTASAPVNVNSGTIPVLRVSKDAGGTPVNFNNVNVLTGGVVSVIMLGDEAAGNVADSSAVNQDN
jgi:hypothetical protein